MSLSVIKQVVKSEIDSTRDCFVKDIESTSQEILEQASSPDARCTFDFAFETAVVNRRFAKLMRGETLDPWPYEGWVKAPPEYCHRETAAADLRASFDEVSAAWDALPETEITKEITTRTGTSTAFELALSAISHGSYHDGQLNYIQTLAGDAAVHWS